MTVLVTGAAGFIGFNVSQALLAQGQRVIGIDNLNDYYDVSLKEARLEILQRSDAFQFHKIDIADWDGVAAVFAANPDITGIIQLAAQAGVRYSLENPAAYLHSNLDGQVSVLEAAKRLPKLEHFVFSSSSSVYAGSKSATFKVSDRTDTPISLYAATKKGGEAISHSYAHLYRMPITSLRFFTVYGPWGRPDMAAFIFARKILAGEPIDIFNNGEMRRDFTYIDDIVAGVLACLSRPPSGEGEAPPYAVYNLGNNHAENLMDFIGLIETELGIKAEYNFLPMQPGDVAETCAEIEESRRDFGFDPTTKINEGLPKFIAWYRDYYGV